MRSSGLNFIRAYQYPQGKARESARNDKLTRGKRIGSFDTNFMEVWHENPIRTLLADDFRLECPRGTQ